MSWPPPRGYRRLAEDRRRRGRGAATPWRGPRPTAVSTDRRARSRPMREPAILAVFAAPAVIRT